MFPENREVEKKHNFATKVTTKGKCKYKSYILKGCGKNKFIALITIEFLFHLSAQIPKE